MIIRPEANLSQNKNFYLLELFEPETKKTNYYFVFSSSRRVETDKVGALIWKSLPSRVEELAKKIEPIISKIIEDNKSRWNEKIEIEKSLELLKDNYSKKIQEKRLIINREAESNKNFNHDLLNLVKASFSTYLYVLYKAGLILVDGKSALSSDEKELVEVNFEEFSYGSEKLAGSQREVFSSREIILDRSDKDLFLISAVVITYNGEKYIYDCLKSLSEQTWPQLEIIVVDNASQDKTCEIIKNNFPQIQLFRFSRNRHFARAVNFGLKKAKGKAILILNQDVVLAKDCVAKLMEKHFKESDSPVGAIVPLLKFYDLKGFINGLGNHLRSFSWGSDNFIGAVDLGQLAQIKAVPSACFAAVLIFREALEKVGPLDDAYSSFYEDIDWSFRCWLNGFKIVPCSEAIVYHHFSSSYVGGQKLFFVCRNRLRLILKLFSLKNLFHFLQNYLAEDLKALFSFLRHRHWDNFLIYLKAYLSLMASLPDILIKRLKFMRRKIKEKNEAHVLALNPESWSFLNTQNEPVINFNLVCHYYLRHIN